MSAFGGKADMRPPRGSLSFLNSDRVRGWIRYGVSKETPRIVSYLRIQLIRIRIVSVSYQPYLNESPMKERVPPRPHRGPGFVIASEKRFGRIRVAVRRAFIVAGDKPITARDVLVRAYARAKHYTDWQRWSVRRALLQDAVVRCSQSPGQGATLFVAPERLKLAFDNCAYKAS